MNFTEIITSVATICPIIIITISIISAIYHYIRKTKQESDEKIMSTIYRRKIISDYCDGLDNTPCSMQSLYREYKSMGGNGFIPMKPYYQIQDDVCNILHNAFPTLKFIVDYDVDREVLRVKLWDPCSQTVVEPKAFKFEIWKTDIDEILNTIIEWYDSCFNPKPKPTVEKVEVIVKPHHCEFCGAPLKKDQRSCEYCGTEYF